ncbi:MAG: lipocalin family protein [Candidatus Celaenobacter antarcticus]|nr:lipocalin family protein [Candidatus Celaenobacter antarcticus]
MKKLVLLFLLTICFISACKEDNMKPMQTVEYVDIECFMGDWYVIAIIPNFIEKNAVNGIESYTRLDNKKIQIDYTFRKNHADGKLKHLKPKAWIYNTKTNSEWRVQFIWPIKVPYLIIDLAKNYSYTVIGEPSRKFVWIMSRKPTIDDDVYQNILLKLNQIGYDVSKIKKMPQIWK